MSVNALNSPLFGWQQGQVGGAQPAWQAPAPAAPNPWAQPQPQLQNALDPQLAAQRVAELEAMVLRLTQQLNAVLAGVAQPPVVNPAPQPVPSPQPGVAQLPAWLSNLPNWLRPAGVQPAPAPVPAQPAPAVPAVPMAADGRPQPLVDAIAAYKNEITTYCERNSSMEMLIFSGAIHAGGPVYLLPGLMLPHGVQMMTWAYLGRAATADELAKYQQWTNEAVGKPNEGKTVFARIIKDIEDRGVFARIQQKMAAGQPVGDLAEEAVAIRKAAGAMLTYAKA